MNECNKKVAPPGQGINDFAHGSTYSKARMRYLLAVWVVRRHRPYTIIQDDELLAIFRMLYSRVEVPHPTTLSKDVKEMFVIAQKNVAKELQVSYRISYQANLFYLHWSHSARTTQADCISAWMDGHLRMSCPF